MQFGASIFFTEYSIAPAELAVALEERGFDSLWVAEHSHIPVNRRFTLPGTMELTKQYYDVMDPFVTLTAAAVATTRLKLATAICLLMSGGRFIFGIGGGWNAEEMENHGTVYATRFQKMREQVEAMKEIWTRDNAEYHGEIVDFGPMVSRPKPVQKPHPPIIVGGAFRHAARRAIRYGDGLLPQGPAAGSGSPEDYMPRLRQMAAEAGRDPSSLPVTIGGAPEDPELLRRYQDLGVTRVTVRMPAAKADEILPVLDRWALLIRRIGG